MISLFQIGSPKSTTLPFTSIFIILFSICAIYVTVENVWAVSPETSLYSDQIEIRNSAYQEKEKRLKIKISSTKNEDEKKSLLLQLQLLNKLNEIQSVPAKPKNNSVISSFPSSWEQFEQFLERYISIKKESKQSVESFENTTKQQQTIYSQLLALAEDDPDQHILQLQHAYQARKSNYQSGVNEKLTTSLKTLKEKFPLLVEQLHMSKQTIDEQKNNLQQAKENQDATLDQQTLALAANEVLIQEQESLLSGYLGQDLNEADQKRMHYNQLKLLELQVRKIITTAQLFESEIHVYEEQQQLYWYQLLGAEENYYRLTDVSGDMNHNIVRLRKEVSQLPPLLHGHETQLSTLRGGNALIGPKAQELVEILEKEIQTTGTQLSAILKRVSITEHKGRLLEKAINFKQSSLTSMVTKTREATGDVVEKIMTIMTYPLLSYNGMTLSLLLFIEVLLLLILSIAINKLYGHFVARIGVQRNWSERTVHLIQATGKYPFIFVVAMVILSIIGVNTSSLALVAGALSVGIGFGMQTIASNLVSGIILLFDKSIRPGDFISLGDGTGAGGFRGNVVQMNTRATVLRTNDNINIIIPNADLIASKVVNWTYGDDKVRFRIPFSIAYGSDIDNVKRLIEEALVDLAVTLSHPAPQIWMTEHDSSSLNFVAAIWVQGEAARQPARTTDTALTTIYNTLTTHNIEIPFQQMDFRFRDNEVEQSVEAKNIIEKLKQQIRCEYATPNA
ncbi:MAG: small-conductance mechanosensitive channel [Desulforhopalus sp.]